MIVWLILVVALCAILAAPALLVGFVLCKLLQGADPYER